MLKLNVCLLFNIIWNFLKNSTFIQTVFQISEIEIINEQKHVTLWVRVLHGMSTLSRKLNAIVFNTIADFAGFARAADYANPSVSKRWSTISESENPLSLSFESL